MAEPPSSTSPRLLGSSAAPLHLKGAGGRTILRLDSANYHWLVAKLATGSGLGGKLFLKLNHIRGIWEITLLNVYLVLAAGLDIPPRDWQLVGSESLYGLSRASIPSADRAGTGLGFSFNVTSLFVEHPFLPSPELEVIIVPYPSLPEKAVLRVEQMDLYYLPDA